jgi:hypothetical protein
VNNCDASTSGTRPVVAFVFGFRMKKLARLEAWLYSRWSRSWPGSQEPKGVRDATLQLSRCDRGNARTRTRRLRNARKAARLDVSVASTRMPVGRVGRGRRAMWAGQRRGAPRSHSGRPARDRIGRRGAVLLCSTRACCALSPGPGRRRHACSPSFSFLKFHSSTLIIEIRRTVA